MVEALKVPALKVAWVTPFAPDRNGGGSQIRQAHLLLGLAARADIQLLCPGPVRDPAVLEAVTTLTEVEPPGTVWRDRHPWLRRAAGIAALAGSRQPREVRWFGRYRPALAAALEQVSADVVLVEHVGLAPLLPRRRGGRWVLTFHNLPSRMAAQQAEVTPHRPRRWQLRREAAIAAAFERRAAAAFDGVITCTDADAAALASRRTPLVVPNGVDLDRFRFRQAPQVHEPRIVFTGALYTDPNIDGARWFCNEVLPLVRSHVADVRLDIVGLKPGTEVLALGSLAGVSVHPDVADVAPFLEAARVAVVPLRIGSGSRLKALEAMAAGRPVVGTSIGMEGLDLAPGLQVLIADDPEEFATATVCVLRDDDLAASLAAGGRAAVQARFDWSSIAARFADSVVEMAGPARAVHPGG